MSPRTIELTHVVLDLELGGLQRIVAELSLRLDRQRFHSSVICLNSLGQFADKLKSGGIEVTLLQKNQRRFDLRDAWRTGRFLRGRHSEVVHIHSGAFLMGALAGAVARTSARIYTDHGRSEHPSRIRVWEDWFAARLVDRIVPVSRELERLFLRTFRIPQRKLHLIINGVDTAVFAPRPRSAELLAEFGLAPASLVVGSSGRLEPIKNYESLIDAFQIVHNRIPQAVLILIGDGALMDQLKARARSCGLERAVIFTGERRDVPSLLNLLDLFVLSSISEGTSVALLEAMASGLPAVVTAVGGNPAIVDHEVNGLLVPTRDTDALSLGIINLLQDEARRREYGQKALNKVRNQYGLDQMVTAYANLYTNLLEKRGLRD